MLLEYVWFPMSYFLGFIPLWVTSLHVRWLLPWSQCSVASCFICLPGLEQIPLYFRELDGEGQGATGKALSSLEMQIIQVIVLMHLLL